MPLFGKLFAKSYQEYSMVKSAQKTRDEKSLKACSSKLVLRMWFKVHTGERQLISGSNQCEHVSNGQSGVEYMKYKMKYSFLNVDLQLVEKELEAAIHAESAVLTEASLHLLQSGGKTNTLLFLCCFPLSLGITIFML